MRKMGGEGIEILEIFCKFAAIFDSLYTGESEIKCLVATLLVAID